jgi:hypothetical protein
MGNQLQPSKRLQLSVDDARFWRVRAAEMRVAADTVLDRGASRGLIAAAETYERVAGRLEGRRGKRGK